MPATIVTGAAGGIGTAIRSLLRSAGHTLVGIDVRPTSDDESYVIDVANEEAARSTVETVAQRHGGVAALIYAAGIVEEHALVDMPFAAWQRVIDASLTGAFVVAKAVLPSMIAAQRGSIVAFSSGYATSGYRNGANYAAAKAGIEALVKSIALENARYGIRANTIAPGPIDSPMVTAERVPIVTPLIPMGRIGTTAEVAALVRFLVSDESAYITGQTIHINGGLLMP